MAEPENQSVANWNVEGTGRFLWPKGGGGRRPVRKTARSVNFGWYSKQIWLARYHKTIWFIFRCEKVHLRIRQGCSTVLHRRNWKKFSFRRGFYSLSGYDYQIRVKNAKRVLNGTDESVICGQPWHIMLLHSTGVNPLRFCFHLDTPLRTFRHFFILFIGFEYPTVGRWTLDGGCAPSGVWHATVWVACSSHVCYSSARFFFHSLRSSFLSFRRFSVSFCSQFNEFEEYTNQKRAQLQLRLWHSQEK